MNPRRALILVDLQNDFLPGGALAVAEGDAVIPIVNRLQPLFELIVASKDWHPRNHGSFAANHPGARVGQTIDLHGLPQILWPVHCVQDTPGAAFVTMLKTGRIAQTFVKGIDPRIDSYSALFDNGHRRSTGMLEYLRERSVTGVFICGLATDYCVKFTALDALREELEVHVIEDACRGVNLRPSDSADALAEICAAGGMIIKGDQLAHLP